MTNETVPVTQADRDAYAEYAKIAAARAGAEMDGSWISRLLAGEMDDCHGVQIAATARHRLSTHPDHDALVEENAQLREALEPFANWAISKLTDSSRYQPDNYPVFAHNNAIITMGDLRRARAALATGEA